MIQLPEWASVIRALSPAQEADQNARSLEMQRTAFWDGNWAPYLEDLRAQGTIYAKMGVSFIAWYDVIAIYRELVRRRLIAIGHVEYANKHARPVDAQRSANARARSYNGVYSKATR